ncbi:MAG: pyroglutamyl-peptidase I [Beijerinckiaceae bacterium]
MQAIRALLTAFGSFPGAPVNPTMAIARLVKLRHGRRLARLGIDLHTAELPVEYAGAEQRARDLIAAMKPDVVLHLGLAARRKRLSFETRARNRLNVLHPDAERRRAGRMTVEANGPATRASRAPVRRCVRAIACAGAACAPSIDAGDYLCNQTLYASLGTQAPSVAFLHVPRPRRPRARRRNGPRRIALAQMADGAAAALIEMAKAARR